jgi:hypothetical protein
VTGRHRDQGAASGGFGPPPEAGGALDGADMTLLGEIRQLAEADDPVPEGLVARIRFAAELVCGFDEEVARLAEVVRMPAEMRADESDSRTITFDGDALSIMISISPAQSAHGVQIDGWLAPPGEHRVEVRTEGGTLTGFSDAQGRFSFDDVPHGLAQLVVHPARPAGGKPSRSVATPSIVL